jgi:hypothetical protein
VEVEAHLPIRCTVLVSSFCVVAVVLAVFPAVAEPRLEQLHQGGVGGMRAGRQKMAGRSD